MFGLFKSKEKGSILHSPCNGKVVPITEVPDPTFAEKILGDGFAVIPAEGKVYAPADGEITMVFDTLHAVTMTTTQGIEILIQQHEVRSLARLNAADLIVYTDLSGRILRCTHDRILEGQAHRLHTESHAVHQVRR